MFIVWALGPGDHPTSYLKSITGCWLVVWCTNTNTYIFMFYLIFFYHVKQFLSCGLKQFFKCTWSFLFENLWIFRINHIEKKKKNEKLLFEILLDGRLILCSCRAYLRANYTFRGQYVYTSSAIVSNIIP